ncbi:MAG: hypothetical protein Q4B70_00950 [Lachnospiraceae bacterium]|nr:hypothetical protein [Lachnospiraceae bacterium]
MVTKQDLEDYLLLRQQIQTLENRIQRLEKSASQYGYGAVKGSNPDFPYQPMSFHVSGYNVSDSEKKLEKIKNLQYELGRQKEEAEEKRLEIEEFIAAIKNREIQLIFSYRYLKGETQEQVGKRMHLDRSRISRKIDNYLKRTKRTE